MVARRVSVRCARPPSGRSKARVHAGRGERRIGRTRGEVTACAGAVPCTRAIGRRFTDRGVSARMWPASGVSQRCAGASVRGVSARMRPADGRGVSARVRPAGGASSRRAGASARGVLFFGGFCQNMDGLAISTLSFRLQIADAFQAFQSFTSSDSR